MHTVDLRTLINVDSETLPVIEKKFGFHIKPVELQTLKKLQSRLDELHLCIPTDGVFFDFSIPNIDKEFDILKVTNEWIINIELKSENKTTDELLQQLVMNYYYLSKVYKNVFCCVYYEETDKLYKLSNGKLVEVGMEELARYLIMPHCLETGIETMFKPEMFLVSPFNDVDKFCKGEYFFTQSQKANQTNIQNTKKNVWLKGSAGTGKTLLVYDLAKKYLDDNKKVVIFHGANLNSGQYELNQRGFHIKAIKDFDLLELDEFDIIIIDEMQRFYKKDLETLLANAKGKVILSGDPSQVLNKKNEAGHELNSDEKIKSFIQENDLLKVELSTKVRTNASLLEFTRGLTNVQRDVDKSKINNEDITFEYFTTDEQALKYLMYLQGLDNTKILTLPSSLHVTDLYTNYKLFDTSFQVIGQEFTSVTLIIGGNISYGQRGGLMDSGVHYSSALALIQNITRSRRKLNLVIVNNPVILKRTLELL